MPWPRCSTGSERLTQCMLISVSTILSNEVTPKEWAKWRRGYASLAARTEVAG